MAWRTAASRDAVALPACAVLHRALPLLWLHDQGIASTRSGRSLCRASPEGDRVAGLGRRWPAGCSSALRRRHAVDPRPDSLRDLTERIAGIFDLAAIAEPAIELDPRRVTPKLGALSCIGVARVSFGVQDFSRHVQG